MSDKKNEDYSIRKPDSPNEKGLSNPPNRRSPAPSLPHQLEHGHSSSLSTLENSPPLSIIAYCLSSISMTLVNKYVVSGPEWNLNFFYLAVQAVVCIVAITVSKQSGLINFAPFNADKAKKWFPISLLLVGMIYTGAKTLQFLSVPVYTIFKNLTIIAIAYGDVLWFGGRVTPPILLSFGLMVLSSVVAAWADIQSAMNGGFGESVDVSTAVSTLNAGYAWMGLNVFCSAAYTLGQRKVVAKLNFKDRDTMFYNNLLSIPILIICSLVAEDWSSDNVNRNFPPKRRKSLFIGMVYSGMGALFISYCSAWCMRVNSSTTYSMVGALNKLPIAISGLIFFAAPVTFGSVSAIILGFISGIVYTWAKIRQAEVAKMVLPSNQPAASASWRSGRDANT